jgi:hypothetical protein
MVKVLAMASHPSTAEQFRQTRWRVDSLRSFGGKHKKPFPPYTTEAFTREFRDEENELGPDAGAGGGERETPASE